jgi:myosin heavy subunit
LFAPVAQVTGKAVQEYYFDPTLVLSESSSITKTPSKVAQSRDAKDALFFQSKYLFVPCTIIKPIVDEENPPQFGQKPALPSNTTPGSPLPIATPPPAPSVNAGKKKKKKKGKGGQNNPSTTIPGSDADAAPVHEPAGNVTFNPNQPYPGPTLVKSSDGALHKISDSTKLIPMNAADYEGVPDILRLSDVSEASLLHTLRLRYRRDEVYTAAGQILISINPYKQIATAGASIYSEEQMMIYRRKGWSDKPPHLFQVADRAYSALVDSVHSTAIGTTTDPTEGGSDTDHQHEARQFPPGKVRNQSIIISGESGAGKTEATKIIMTFLAKITRKNGGSMIEALAERVLSSNPLLETFGNAQTLRNNNSSRFGKFIHIYFDCLSGAITGASISNYLLEKTRITNQVEGERNYHIFYQLLSGADGDMAKAFGLEGGPGHFRYLGNKGETSPDDRIAFSETVSCLKSIGLSEQEQRSVFGMAAAVLHLGNVQFEEGDAETAKVSENSMPSLCKACESLGIDVDAMSEAILTKIIFVNGSPIHKPQNVALAEDKRDALAKMTYSCLFLWLVNCVNEKLRETSATGETDQPNFRPPVPTETYHPRFRGFIGCLDIYGFESFDINGFEQLLINYCNETLQRHFNRHLFEVEQDLYANEGVDWSYITFNDNRPCLELIEGGGGSVGILNALDDAWSGMGNAAKKEVTFAKTLQCVSHPNFITSKFGNDREFTIVHYAGSVKVSTAA